MAGVKKPGKPDAEYMTKMREAIKLQKESDARIASREPAPAPKSRKIEPLTERIVFGMGSRKKMSR